MERSKLEYWIADGRPQVKGETTSDRIQDPKGRRDSLWQSRIWISPVTRFLPYGRGCTGLYLESI